MTRKGGCRVAVVVAHPDDETLWCGGTALLHSEWAIRVLSVCRGSDDDRAPRYRAALEALGVTGEILDFDDGPDQAPLGSEALEASIAAFLGTAAYDFVLTHGPRGEYTRHRRHEEVCRAVAALWHSRGLATERLWFFAYDDQGRTRLPMAEPSADEVVPLPGRVWEAKYRIITDIYGFSRESWEARATPRVEAFWTFDAPDDAAAWVRERQPEA